MYDTPRWAQVFIRALILFGLLFIAKAVFAGRPNPTITCGPFIYPLIKCEAQYVFPIDPRWYVYYWNSDDRADFDRGIVTFLNIPDNHFVRIEMCTSRERCTSIYGRWLNGKTEFSATKRSE